MKYLFQLIIVITIFSCNLNEEVLAPQTKSVLTQSNGISIEYNSQNLVSKYIFPSGHTVEFFYNTNNTLSSFETSGNPTYPLHIFEVTNYENSEISGDFKIFDANGVEAEEYRETLVYNTEGDLLKSWYRYDKDGNEIYHQSFIHDTNNNLIDFVKFETGQNHQLTNIKPTQWDDKPNSSIFVTPFLELMNFNWLPHLKVSQNNILAFKMWTPTINWGETSWTPEYNEFDQLTSLYSLVEQIDEYGNIIDTTKYEHVFVYEMK